MSDAPAPRTRPRQEASARLGTVLVAVLMAPFMALLDIFIVNVAAPSIERQLPTTFAGVQLVIGSYIVAFAMGLVTGGRIGDIVGRRRSFVLGIAAFAVTSAGCGLAPSLAVLVVMRLLQGFSSALMLPQVLALIQVTFASKRQLILGFYGAAQSAGSISGQLLGGVLIHFDLAGLGWRAIFLVNVPLSLVAIACAMLGISEQDSRPTGVRFDPLGVGLLSLAVAALLAPLVFGPPRGWPAVAWLVLAGSLLLFAVFWAWESRIPATENRALFPVQLLKLHGFAYGLPTAIAFYTGNAGFYLVLAFYLQDSVGLSPLGAAFEFVPLGVVFALASLASRAIVVRFGYKVVVAGAGAILTGLLLMYASVSSGDHLAQALRLLPGLVLCGIGQGLVLPSLLSLVLGRVEPQDAGAASGAVLTASQIAGSLGVAGVGAVFNSVVGNHGERAAFGASVLALCAIAVASIVLLTRLTADATS